jgi:membrane protein insertase Oxa1/YidC/SpoIIIJ
MYSQQRQREEVMRALTSSRKEIERRHQGDQDAIRCETMALYRQQQIDPVGSCLRPIALSLAWELPVLFTARSQSLPELLAGIVVVRD